MSGYDEVQRQLERARSDLRHLELERSKYAGLGEPLRLLHDVEDTTATIAELEARLAAWPRDDAGQPLPTDRDFAKVEKRYRERVVEVYGPLSFQGLEQDFFLQDIPLEEVFVKLTLTVERVVRRRVERPTEEAAGERFTLFGRRRETERRREAERAEREIEVVERVQEPISLGKALAEHPSLLISGEPGAGKTTLLRWLAVTFARNLQGQPDRLGVEFAEPRLPIVVELGRFAHRFMEDEARIAPPDLESIIAETLEAEFPDLPTEFLANALAQGRCLVLCDGFDEIADPNARRRAVRSLQAFARRHLPAGNRLVIGSRPYGHREVQTDFPCCTIQPFTPEDVQHFIQHWYDLDTALTPQECREAAKTLFDKIEAEPRILKLAQTPLLSTIIILVYRNRGSLPKRRVELYEHCVRILLERWEGDKDIAESGVIGRASWRTQLRLLEPVAYHIHSVEQRTAAQGDELLPVLAKALVNEGLCEADKALLEAEQFLAALGRRSALFQHLGGDVYAFPHPTFQEYLAARYIAAQPDPDYIDLFMPHLHEAWWREVHLLTIGHLGASDCGEERFSALIEAIRSHYREPLFLLRSVSLVSGTSRWLKDSVSLYQSPYISRRFARGLAQIIMLSGFLLHCLGSSVAKSFPAWQFERRLAWILSRAYELIASSYVERASGNTTRSANLALFDRMESLLLELVCDPARHEDQQHLLETICQSLEGRASEVVGAKLFWIQNDLGVQEVAVRSLGRLGLDSWTTKTVVSLLEALASENWGIRATAAASLGQLGRPTEDVMSALIQALKDENLSVRVTAVKALDRLREPSREVALALVGALDDEDCLVRWQAVDSLGHLGGPEDVVVPSLVRALDDDDWVLTCEAAASSLVQLVEVDDYDVVVRALLEALSHNSVRVRQAAASILVQLGRTEELVVTTLVEALGADDWFVGDKAVKSLSQLRSSNETVVSVLARAMNAESENTRRLVVETLGRLGQASAAVVEVLLHALDDDSDYVKRQAVYSLGELRYPSETVVKTLLCSLQERNGGMQLAAATSLGQLGQASDSVVKALLQALDDDSDYVKRAAAFSLIQLGQVNEMSVAALVRALDSDQWHVRWLAAGNLGQLDDADETIVMALVRALSDDETYVRRAAVESLGQLDQASEAAVTALVQALGDGDEGVRRVAATSLRRLSQASETALTALLRALDDDSGTVRLLVAESLGQLECKDEAQLCRVLVTLNRCLHGTNDNIRQAALASIQQLLDGRPIPGYRWVPVKVRREKSRRRLRRAALVLLALVMALAPVVYLLAALYVPWVRENLWILSILLADIAAWIAFLANVGKIRQALGDLWR